MWRIGNIKEYASIIFLTVILILPKIINAQTQILWSEDWERSNWNDDWSVDNGTWEVGSPTSGPDSAYAGNQCAATVLAGNYSENVTTRLIKDASFVVPSADKNPRLRFWSWYSLSSDDGARVQIKTTNSDWKDLSPTYTGSCSNLYYHTYIDLAEYADSTVQIAFYFYSRKNIYGDTHVSSGWYIDDVSVESGPISFINPEDWESGIDDWYVDFGTWQVGIPTVGPDSAHSGSRCAGTVLDGDYIENVNSRLISPPFKVPTSFENPRLRFWSWYSLSSDDGARVQIKTINGAWKDLSPTYTGSSSNLYYHTYIDLSEYADSTVQIAFYFYSRKNIYGDTHVSSGWYIDDVSVETGPVKFINPEDWESGINDWYVDFGTWQVGVPTSGPDSAHTITHCAATILNGNYIEGVRSRIISPPIQVPSIDKNPKLTFWHWYSISSDDAGYVQIKTKNGNWENVLGPYKNTSSGIWTPPSFQLSSYADSVIQIAFYFESNKNIYGDTHVSSGWYVDDIKITGVNNSPEITSFTANPSSGQAPLNVSFTAQASDADGSIVDYYWDFDGDGLNDDTTSTGTNSHIYTENGTYNATCRVSDDQGAISAPASQQINVYAATTRVVSVPDDSASVDGTFILPIRIDDVAGIAGAEFKLNYDPTILEALNVSITDLTAGFTITDSVTNGTVAISMARATGLTAGGGDFVNITFHVSADARAGQTSSLNFGQVSLFDADTNPIESTTEDGLFTVKKGGVSAGSLTKIVIKPGADTLSVSQTTQFSAYGIDSEKNQVDIDVSWKYQDVFQTPGEIDAASGHSTVFTATGKGDGYIAATYIFETDTLVDTAYVIVGNTKGDINIDETVNVPDAILCLQISADIIDPSLYQIWAADFNNNQSVNSADALEILTEAIKGLLPKSGYNFTTIPSGFGSATIYSVEEFDESTGFLRVPLYIENRRDICGLDLNIDYNKCGYDLVDVSAGKTSSLLVKNTEHAKISTINISGLANEQGEIICLYFKQLDKNATAANIRFSSINICDQSGKAIVTNLELNRPSVNNVAAKFDLYQNFPNPFNPSTTIRYNLPRAGNVKINIYNINGQLVRSLISEKMDAGMHAVTWNGNDNMGRLASSGVYFYRIIYNDGAWYAIKKMLFVK